MGHFLNADGFENSDRGITDSSSPELGRLQHWQSCDWPAADRDQAIQNQSNLLKRIQFLHQSKPFITSFISGVLLQHFENLKPQD
tara:strand:+ start:204 stop:458 length:255 start_codon:yes stop_codon:yes gene_type:complete